MFKVYKVRYIQVLTIISLISLSTFAQGQLIPYTDHNLPFIERVDDLVQRMTLEEKISQMLDASAAIPRLGIGEYNWWSEGLHGVARAGIATVFPQAIGLAATFNDGLHFQVATAISDEFRANYNRNSKAGNFGRYRGLTVWSPNINIFRDPRWGRGQETYGEDPYLTARMGVAFVKGLQGSDPKYLKVIATPKHYVVHSGPESSRHTFNAEVSDDDFTDTYLPAFKACIVEGKAFSVMSAYNKFRRKSCTASDTLLNQILRNQWGFQGYIVSDCDAVSDIYMTHKIVKTPSEAAALGVINGCDLNCGETYPYLIGAVKEGLITEKQIDVAVKRLMLARMKLGMFDPQEMVPFNHIPDSIVDCLAHRKLSGDAARQSLVLLKNEKNILPLNRNINSIAVIGPNANEAEILLGNYNGIPSKAVTPLEGIKMKVSSHTNIYFNPLTNHVDNSILKMLIPSENLSYNGKTGLKMEIFDNRNLEGKPVIVRTDTKIDLFGEGLVPGKGMKNTDFSIRWTGDLLITETGKYDLFFTGDDGYRVWIDGKLVMDYWVESNNNTASKTFDFKKGEKHSLKVEYFQYRWIAKAKLEWTIHSEKTIEDYVTEAAKSDVIIYFGGLSPFLEGEEMNVPYDGFSGGDRTKIDLPAIQEKTLKLLKATGKPVILVNLSGSAIALNWENQNLDAIIQAWYPGEEGGAAIADVVFGDYNPAGRLPVTFYKSLDQLPSFDDYAMKNRTYRYLKQEPLYPFGFGLSYTTFKYANLKLEPVNSLNDSILVSAEITNTGTRDGDEVAQLYSRLMKPEEGHPNISLQGFKRISLKAGETKQVHFLMATEPFHQPAGNWEILLGSSSDNLLLKSALNLK
jgi:beta-glucosidase